MEVQQATKKARDRKCQVCWRQTGGAKKQTNKTRRGNKANKTGGGRKRIPLGKYPNHLFNLPRHHPQHLLYPTHPHSLGAMLVLPLLLDVLHCVQLATSLPPSPSHPTFF